MDTDSHPDPFTDGFGHGKLDFHKLSDLFMDSKQYKISHYDSHLLNDAYSNKNLDPHRILDL